MTFLTTVVAFVLALAVLIAFHEYGHYWAARRCGVKVLRFSIGFGRTLWMRRDRRGTEWVVAAIPLGGFVRMVDEREGDVAAEDLPFAFNRQSLGARAFIVFAGPFANFLLAALLFWGLYMAGVPGLKPFVAAPATATAAARAGFAGRDEILSVDGHPLRSWQEVNEALMLRLGRTARVEVRAADGRLAARDLRLPDDPADMDQVGLAAWLPPLPPVVGQVVPGSRADIAGLKPLDRVVRIDGAPVADWEALVAQVRGHPGVPLRVEVLRRGAPAVLVLTPENIQSGGQRVGRIGAGVLDDPATMRPYEVVVRRDPLRALGTALEKTWDITAQTVVMLGRLVTGHASVKNLSGPLTIADMAGQTARLGLVPYVSFLAVISVSLGIMNLLPVPVLDGGHLMYYMVERIKGSPVSERALRRGQQVGISLLLLLMGCAFYNDLSRLFAN